MPAQASAPAAAEKCVAAKALAATPSACQRAAGVEAEPADPQQRRADRRVRQIVRRHRLAAEAQPFADQQRTDQRRNARADMHDRSAGEIERAAAKRLRVLGAERQNARRPRPNGTTGNRPACPTGS